MFDFRKLLKLLEKELNYQEQLLKLLVRERTAIVKMQQAELEHITVEKQQLLTQAKEVEQRRQEIFADIQKNHPQEQPIKFSEIVALCPVNEGKGNLTLTGEKLRKIATSVKELNDENASLIKHSLGLIVSTLSIMTAVPDADLPTYTAGGRLQGDAEDPAFVARRPVAREA